jgi:hypothetical protein
MWITPYPAEVPNPHIPRKLVRKCRSGGLEKCILRILLHYKAARRAVSRYTTYRYVYVVGYSLERYIITNVGLHSLLDLFMKQEFKEGRCGHLSDDLL